MPLPIPLSADALGRIKAAAAAGAPFRRPSQCHEIGACERLPDRGSTGRPGRLLPLSEDRVKIVRWTRDHLTDPENAYLLHRCFPDLRRQDQTVARLLRRESEKVRDG